LPYCWIQKLLDFVEPFGAFDGNLDTWYHLLQEFRSREWEKVSSFPVLFAELDYRAPKIL